MSDVPQQVLPPEVVLEWIETGAETELLEDDGGGVFESGVNPFQPPQKGGPGVARDRSIGHDAEDLGVLVVAAGAPRSGQMVAGGAGDVVEQRAESVAAVPQLAGSCPVPRDRPVV